MGDHRLAAARARIEIGVQHAGGTGELKLSRLSLPHVELGLAELCDEAARISAEHPFLTEDGRAADRGDRCGRCVGLGHRSAGAEQEQEAEARRMTLRCSALSRVLKGRGEFVYR